MIFPSTIDPFMDRPANSNLNILDFGHAEAPSELWGIVATKEKTFPVPNPNILPFGHAEASSELWDVVAPPPESACDESTLTVTLSREVLARCMWSKECNGKIGVCAICPTCGGSSASFCACREKEFRQRVTDAALLRFLGSELGFGAIVASPPPLCD